MSTNTARQYEQEDVRVTPRVPAQVIPLRPTTRQRDETQAQSVLTQERIAEVVLAVTTIVLAGLLSFALYHGLQNYMVF